MNTITSQFELPNCLYNNQVLSYKLQVFNSECCKKRCSSLGHELKEANRITNTEAWNTRPTKLLKIKKPTRVVGLLVR